MLRSLKILIKNCKMLIVINYYNRKNCTDIRSLKANLNAKYGKNVLIGTGTTVGEDVSIGDQSYINDNSYIENCNIGKYCSISSGVYISPAEHCWQLITTHPFTKSEDKRRKVEIGNDVLISLNAIILEGVTIGNGAVVGAGAVVTKDVMSYEIVGGVPAKHIKYRFEEEKIKLLEKIEWWHWEKEKIDLNISWFRNERDTINELD